MLNFITKQDALAGRLPKKSFTKERVYYIRDKINLYYFLAWYNSDDFKQETSQFRKVGNNAVVIGKDKRYCKDFSSGKTYDFYAFCKEFLGLSFYSALFLGNEFMNETLAQNNFSKNQPLITFDNLQNQISKGAYFVSKNFSQSWAYLCNTRGIDRTLINYLYDNDLIYLQRYGNNVNVCFPFTDLGEFITGFEVIGCLSDVRFKNVICAETDSYFVFKKYYDSESDNTKMFVFESVIDLLSFSSLLERKQIVNDIKDIDSLLLISLRGVNQNIMRKAMDDYGICIDDIYSFTDSDIKSFNFIEKFKKYNDDFGAPAEYLKGIDIKDWNDLLIKGFEGTIKFTELLKSQLPW